MLALLARSIVAAILIFACGTVVVSLFEAEAAEGCRSAVVAGADR